MTPPHGNARPRPRLGFSLRRKLALLALAAVLLPSLTLGVLQYRSTAAVLRENVEVRFRSVVEIVADSADRTLSDAERGLSLVARSLADNSISVDQRIAAATRVVAEVDALGSVAVYDQAGALIDTIRTERAAHPALPATLAASARQASAPAPAEDAALGLTIADVAVHERVPHALLVQPVVSDSATWYVASYVSLMPTQRRIERLIDSYIDHLAGTEQAAVEDSIYLLDDHYRLLAHSDREMVEHLGAISDREILRGVDPKALAHGVYVARHLEAEGIMAGLQKLPSLPWLAVVELPAEAAFQQLQTLRHTLLAIGLAVVLLALLAALWLARRLTAPIDTLVRYADDLAARRFTRRAAVDTGDELGVLGAALSDAADKLAASEQRVADEIAIRADLGRYLPEQLVENIVQRVQPLALGGERRTVTVMFADVAGFTRIAEQHPAEVLVTILNQLFTILTEIVFRHDGTVDKFIGDCVMAFWGAPDPQEDHAARALAAAEDMQSWLEVGNENWQREFGVTISLAIGVHTGEAVVGNFGSETRMEYTVIGDTVNVAAHLESIARPEQILVSSATRDAAGDEYDYIELGQHAVAGRREPVELCEVRL
ncbi:MAG: hypothetical protein Tsb0020_31380 [Haliangiales bacterium]